MLIHRPSLLQVFGTIINMWGVGSGVLPLRIIWGEVWGVLHLRIVWGASRGYSSPPYLHSGNNHTYCGNLSALVICMYPLGMIELLCSLNHFHPKFSLNCEKKNEIILNSIYDGLQVRVNQSVWGDKATMEKGFAVGGCSFCMSRKRKRKKKKHHKDQNDYSSWSNKMRILKPAQSLD